MKKIIVTGATSMIGVALINECLKNNIHVLAICKKNSFNKHRIPTSPLIDIIEEDFNNINNLSNIVNKSYDIFYHFGWLGTDKVQRMDPFFQMENITYTLQAIKLAKELGCKTFVGAGSQAEYGQVNLPKIAPNTPINPDIAYGIAKYSAGKLGAIYAKQLDIQYIWTRIFSVYGIFDNPYTLISNVLKNLLKNESVKLTKAEQIWDYLYSEDAGRAFLLIGLHGKNQATYCIGSGIGKPLYEYMNIIKKEIHTNTKIIFGAIPYASNQVMNLCADITNLTRDTGFFPNTTFEQGIRKTIQWVLSEKSILDKKIPPPGGCPDNLIFQYNYNLSSSNKIITFENKGIINNHFYYTSIKFIIPHITRCEGSKYINTTATLIYKKNTYY